MPQTSYTGELFKSLTAEALQQIRDDVRQRLGPRLAYDCYNTILVGDRVQCRKGYDLLTTTRDGTVSLLQCLKGSRPHACQKCKDYDV